MKKIIMATILFGSIWGLLECSLGDWLHEYNLSVVMASIAIFLMALTRRHFAQPGMQLGMAFIAAMLRHFNPIGGCLVCASIAIFIEGVAFEVIWLIPWQKYQSMVMKMSMGVISFYTIYAVGYIATQILTPLLTAKFYLKDLIAVMPKILAGSTIAGIIGIFALPFAYLPLKIEMEKKLYYGTSVAITIICWIAVIAGI
ncbi:MAG: hypothetical protein FE041_04395 [Thermoplasmata archaeon]|nr:MAG: hypothetical protein FE041_04395 [Thermoplasmata archaeon]